jgi:F0F1-type ATP synthase assembly protein I
MGEINGTANGWNEYKRRVLFQLDHLTDRSDVIEKKIDETKEHLSKQITDVEKDIVMIKAKAAAYGGIAGLIASIIVGIIVGLILRAI